MDIPPLVWPALAVVAAILLWNKDPGQREEPPTAKEAATNKTIRRGMTLGTTLVVCAFITGIVLLIGDGEPVVLHGSLEGRTLTPLAYAPLGGLLMLYLALFTGALGRSGAARLLFAIVGLAVLTSGLWLGGGAL